MCIISFKEFGSIYKKPISITETSISARVLPKMDQWERIWRFHIIFLISNMNYSPLRAGARAAENKTRKYKREAFLMMRGRNAP